jgi:Rrf2 family iron-sulfur cluster assembly transcriptional regulator
MREFTLRRHVGLEAAVRLSSKGRYGVRALFDIAFHNAGRPAQMREIAVRAEIPARVLEQIFQDLRRAGLVAAKRGPRGGYHLARPASEIRIGDVLRALEGSVVQHDEDGDVARDPTAAVFRDLACDVERCFDGVTIADVCARGSAMGLRREHLGDVPDYAI